MSAGERIRQLRVRHCLTQAELGRMVGVEKAAINKYETGRVVNLKHDMIEKLANALCTTPEYIAGYAECDSSFDAVLLEAYYDAGAVIQKAIRVLLELEVEA